MTLADVHHRLGWSKVLLGTWLAIGVSTVSCRQATEPPVPPTHEEQGVWTNSLGMRFKPIPGMPGVWMSVWETRVRDFKAFIDATGHDATDNYYYYDFPRWQTGEGKSWMDPGFDQTPLHPVVGVSWVDAQGFCHWLTEHERAAGLLEDRHEYRLPSNEEWSQAAAPEVISLSENSANYHSQLGLDPFDFTAPVGSFPANANGFYDMAGNVWEYCRDPVGKFGGSHIIRGGCWQNGNKRFVGVQAQGAIGSSVRMSLYGFRVVLYRGAVMPSF